MSSREWKHLAYVTVCTSALLVASTASADPILQVSGQTLACFDVACGSFTPSASNSPSGIAFTGADPFNLNLGVTGVGTVTLGTFERGRTRMSSDAAALSFTIDVLFSLPGGDTTATATPITGSIVGTTPGGGGPVAIDFDNTWHRFTTPTGTFEFAILSDLEINKNGAATVIGSVRHVEDTGATSASVPEPAALMLVGLGLLGLRTRRRRK